MSSLTPRFERAVQFVLDHETVFKPRSKWGDYNYATWEADPADPGGLTKFGIDQRSHPHEDIKRLTLERAKLIYFTDYWLPSDAGQMPPGYGEVLFDIRVNGGDGPHMLQHALNLLLLQDHQLVEDGLIGPKTMQAINQFGTSGVLALLQVREARYQTLAQTKPRMKKFLAGWLARNRDLMKFVLDEG